jgi:hypothetical protein
MTGLLKHSLLTKNRESLMAKVGETESFVYYHHSAMIKEMKISNLSHTTIIVTACAGG